MCGLNPEPLMTASWAVFHLFLLCANSEAKALRAEEEQHEGQEEDAGYEQDWKRHRTGEPFGSKEAYLWSFGLFVCLAISPSTFLSICVCMCLHMHAYIYRERERQRERHTRSLHFYTANT